MSGLTPITQTEDSGSDPEQEIPSMSPEDLRALIEGDAEASQMASAGQWQECAARCVEIAPHAVISLNLDFRGLVKAAPSLADAAAIESLLSGLEAMPNLSPLIKRLLPWLNVPAAGGGGLDVGDSKFRAALTLPVEQGGCGLTAEQAAPLLRIAERPQTISPLECRVAMTGA